MIRGLHHVTATVNEAQPDVDFYTRTLGLRLVKKTVNFDNTQVYHLYYGDEAGSPGTLMTTFPYGGWGVRTGTHGNGQIGETRFAIPVGSAGYWRQRLSESDLSPTTGQSALAEAFVSVVDPSGLRIVLVEATDDRPGWTGGEVAAEHRITGLHSVSFAVDDVAASASFLERLLGWEAQAVEGDTTRMASDGGGAGRWIDLVSAPGGSRGVNGLGTVHHVAMSVDDDDAQLRVRGDLIGAGVPVTEVKDRQYFRSIYFREPGGVLYEVATIPPGFATDEAPDELGQALKLPPWEEANRERIAAGLAPLRDG